VSLRPPYDVARILITVKAYPAVGQKTGESVCVAGVRLDGDQVRWARLFPVGFRDLPVERQFDKYQVVALRVKRRSTDRRPESLTPDLDSLALGPMVGTDGASWRTRAELLEPLIGATTTCELATRASVEGQDAPSLGLIEPADVSDLVVTDNPDFDSGAGRHADVDLFGRVKSPLKSAPFIAKYRYRCRSGACPGHEQTLIDWESGVLARKNLHKGSDEARRLHRERFLTEMCGPGRATHFFVGNQHQYPQSFLVLGVWWPPRGSGQQASLDL
jgi:hypothetical protein